MYATGGHRKIQASVDINFLSVAIDPRNREKGRVFKQATGRANVGCGIYFFFRVVLP